MTKSFGEGSELDGYGELRLDNKPKSSRHGRMARLLTKTFLTAPESESLPIKMAEKSPRGLRPLNIIWICTEKNLVTATFEFPGFSKDEV